MAIVQYVSYALILSNALGGSAFHSVSNGAVNVDCARVNTTSVNTRRKGSEKAVETLQATCRSIIDKLKARESIFDNLIQELRALRSSPTQPHDISHHASQPPPHGSPPNTAKQNSVTLYIAAQPPKQPATPTPPSATQLMMDHSQTMDAQALVDLHAATDSPVVSSPLPLAAMASKNPHDEVPFAALSAASNEQQLSSPPPQRHEVPILGKMPSEFGIFLKVPDTSEVTSLGTVPASAPSPPPPPPLVPTFNILPTAFMKRWVKPKAKEFCFSKVLFSATLNQPTTQQVHQPRLAIHVH